MKRIRRKNDEYEMKMKKKTIVFEIMAQERTLTPLTHSKELTVFSSSFFIPSAHTTEQKIWIFFSVRFSWWLLLQLVLIPSFSSVLCVFFRLII